MSQNPINFSSTSENNVSVYKHLTSYRSFYSDKSIVYKSQRTLRFDLLSLPLPLLISRLGFHNQNFSHVLICIGISFLSISLDLQILNRCGDSILPSIIIFRGPFFGFFIKGFRFHQSVNQSFTPVTHTSELHLESDLRSGTLIFLCFVLESGLHCCCIFSQFVVGKVWFCVKDFDVIFRS